MLKQTFISGKNCEYRSKIIIVFYFFYFTVLFLKILKIFRFCIIIFIFDRVFDFIFWFSWIARTTNITSISFFSSFLNQGIYLFDGSSIRKLVQHLLIANILKVRVQWQHPPIEAFFGALRLWLSQKFGLLDILFLEHLLYLLHVYHLMLQQQLLEFFLLLLTLRVGMHLRKKQVILCFLLRLLFQDSYQKPCIQVLHPIIHKQIDLPYQIRQLQHNLLHSEHLLFS
eukprot:09481_2